MIAAASVYVASKVNDTVRRLRDFVNVVYFIIYPKSSQPIGIGSSVRIELFCLCFKLYKLTDLRNILR